MISINFFFSIDAALYHVFLIGYSKTAFCFITGQLRDQLDIFIR
jgi:hypothetical protein